FEERTAELFQEGLVKGTAHSYVGEEAIASAVGSILRDDDYMASNHRGHGHCIAKGAKLDRMMAELMGRDTGYCHGLGGSMHIADMNLNILGANGIVGAAMPLSTGTALAAKLRGTDQVVVAFFGDGGSNQGIFHESLNLASVWKLPVLFICENNQYALSTSYKRTTSAAQISDRAIGYQVPGVTIDGNDPE
ncbi:MAG: thiamine pyrophosphate-dependent dehydrogenase E1 component subunit alpha, partial [Rhodospirillaceae bacterium]|nr:thiamine pyrophosphate-dependent dehydrogenase E1 component subunit alpha [Rhodospirillaceae bacterium]